jgi:hypothetical protein
VSVTDMLLVDPSMHMFLRELVLDQLRGAAFGSLCRHWSGPQQVMQRLVCVVMMGVIPTKSSH